MLTCFAVPSRTGVPRKVTAMSGSRLGQNLRGLRFANFRHNTQSNTQNRSGSGRKVPQIQGISQGKCVKKGETAGQEVPLLHFFEQIQNV